jgi:hypothetical protein
MPQVVAFTRRSKSSELFDPRNAEWFGPARESAPQRAVRVGKKNSAAINRAHEQGLKA